MWLAQPPRVESNCSCVVDAVDAVGANVLIDFHRGRLLQALFALPLPFLTPEVIGQALAIPDGRALLGQGLRSVCLTGGQVAAVVTLATVHRRPSVNELLALVLARSEKATLLTGDKGARQVAESEGIV
jgi:hypothetical protein